MTPNDKSARLQQLIHRKDKVLAVLHPPTAARLGTALLRTAALTITLLTTVLPTTVLPTEGGGPRRMPICSPIAMALASTHSIRRGST